MEVLRYVRFWEVGPTGFADGLEVGYEIKESKRTQIFGLSKWEEGAALLSCRSLLMDHIWGKIRNSVLDMLSMSCLLDNQVEKPVDR